MNELFNKLANVNETTDPHLEDRVEMLEEAQEKLREAHELIETAIRGTEQENHASAYLLDPLRIMIDSDHGFASNDLNVERVIANLRGDGDG